MHVAIIMDGNGRWAAKRHLPRTAGHRAGAKAVNAVVEAAARRGVDTLTLYAFSAANWARPHAEVNALFTLLQRYLLTQTRRCLEQSIRINIIGRRDRLGPELLRTIEYSERATAGCRTMLLRIAVDYSAQYSLQQVARRMPPDAQIDRDAFLAHLAAVDHCVPCAGEVDLLIRTGGEQRLSDFLLWESAYAELHFASCFWPDFNEHAFAAALEDFDGRERRFGRVVPAPSARRTQA